MQRVISSTVNKTATSRNPQTRVRPMNSAFSLGHRSLSSAASSYYSLSDSLRRTHIPDEMAHAPMSLTNRSCQHSPSEDLPCARRILKTVKQDGAVTQTWVSCRGTRFVSTTMPLLYGINEEQVSRDAALLGHTREENRSYRQQARTVSPRTRPDLQTDCETQSEASLPSRSAAARPQSHLSTDSSPEPSSEFSLH